MAACVLTFLVIVELATVFASYLQQGQQYYQVPGQQYYQIPSSPPHPIVNSHPAVNSYTPTTPAVYQPTASSIYNDYSSYPVVTPQVPSYKPPVTPPVQPPKISELAPTKPKTSPTSPPKGLDSNVLNNLAIALQLLIVSNLLNTPIPESLPLASMRNALQQTQKMEYESIQPKNPQATYYQTNEPLVQSYPTQSTQEYQAYFETNPYEQSINPQHSYPNSNFVGSSNLGGLLGFPGVPPATPRQGFKLQSPYDALASGYSEPSSLFEHTKRDFQSPYAAILADNNKDLFSMDFY